MDEYYRDRARGQKIVFDPLARNLRKPTEEGIYGDIAVEKNVTSSVTSEGAQKICIAVLCIAAVLVTVSAGVALAIILSAGK